PGNCCGGAPRKCPRWLARAILTQFLFEAIILTGLAVSSVCWSGWGRPPLRVAAASDGPLDTRQLRSAVIAQSDPDPDAAQRQLGEPHAGGVPHRVGQGGG